MSSLTSDFLLQLVAAMLSWPWLVPDRACHLAINVVFSMCFSNVAGRGDELLTVAGSPQSMPHGHVSSFHMLFSGAAGNGNALLTVTWSQTEPATWQKKKFLYHIIFHCSWLLYILTVTGPGQSPPRGNKCRLYHVIFIYSWSWQCSPDGNWSRTEPTTGPHSRPQPGMKEIFFYWVTQKQHKFFLFDF